MSLLQIIYQKLCKIALMWMTLHLFLVLTRMRLPHIPREYLFLTPGILAILFAIIVWAGYYRDKQEKNRSTTMNTEND